MGNLERVLIPEILKYEQAATADARAHPMRAEILCERGRWYVLRVQPGRERTAAAALAGRGFGVYLPMADETVISRGRRRKVSHPLVPGYLPTFVWGLDEQWPRIRSCTGVSGLLRLAEVGGLGAPVIIADAVINRIQLLEFNENVDNLTFRMDPPPELKKAKKRSRRKEPRAERELRFEHVEIATVRCWSQSLDGDNPIDSQPPTLAQPLPPTAGERRAEARAVYMRAMGLAE